MPLQTYIKLIFLWGKKNGYYLKLHGRFILAEAFNQLKKKSKSRSVIVFLTEQIKSIDLKKMILEAYLEKKKDSFFFFQFYTEPESMLKQSR